MTRIRDSIGEKETDDHFLNDDYTVLEAWVKDDPAKGHASKTH